MPVLHKLCDQFLYSVSSLAADEGHVMYVRLGHETVLPADVNQRLSDATQVSPVILRQQIHLHSV